MELECTKCSSLLSEHIQKVVCGSSCRECGRYAHFADEPSYLYLATNSSLDLHKIGIGIVGKDKEYLQKLILADWVIYGLWHTGEKRKTFQWEKAIFKKLKTEIDPATQGFIGKSDRHWVESISAQTISLTDLADLISKVISSKGQ